MKSEKKLRKKARKAKKRQRLLLEDMREIVARADFFGFKESFLWYLENNKASSSSQKERYEQNPNAWKCVYKCAS